jgi:hypothetical protein
MAAGELILTHGVLKMDMTLVPMQSTRMGSSGNSVRVQLGPSRWRLDVETTYLPVDKARLWDTWLASRIHAGETFTAYRKLREQPSSALGTADGSIGLTVDAANGELDLTEVGAYVASKGDMISYRTDVNGYYLGMIMADVTAAAGAVTVPVIPTPLAKHASTPAVRRVQALGEFELTSTIEPFDDYTANPGGRRLMFQAMQVLR